MSSWRLTLIFTVLSVTILACFPCLLRVAEDSWFEPEDGVRRLARLEAVVARYPHDPELRFAYALAADDHAGRVAYRAQTGEPLPSESAETARQRAHAAWQKAFRIPGSGPAPRLACVAPLLWDALPRTPGREARSLDWHPSPTTPQGRRDAAEALSLLREAAALDPANARTRYLLALVYFAHGQDAAGWRAVHDAERAPGWDSYSLPLATAAYRLARADGETETRARARGGVGYYRLAIQGSTFRTLGHLLAGRGHAHQAEGNHAAALAAYQSTLLYTQRARFGARDVNDAFGLAYVVPLVTVDFLPQVFRDRRMPLQDTREGRDWAKLTEAMAFACYANAHGRPDVGALAVTEAQAGSSLSRELSAAITGPRSRLKLGLLVTVDELAQLLPVQVVYMLAAGLLWLLPLGWGLRTRRLPTTVPLPWPTWLWALAAPLVLTSVGAAACVLTHLVSYPSQAMVSLWWTFKSSVAFLGLPCPVALTYLSWLAVRRAVAAAPEAPWPSVAATAMVHSFAAAAALVLFIVLWLGLDYAIFAASTAESWRALQQGELHLWGITGY